MFDSWDDDKGGSLDLKELKSALTKVQEAARMLEEEARALWRQVNPEELWSQCPWASPAIPPSPIPSI